VKLKKLGIFTSLLALGLLLTACGPSIKEKKEEFGKTIDALLEQGFVLEKKEEGEKKSIYLLKLDKSREVTDFLLRSALGSSDAQLRKELSDRLRGTRLELDVDWQRYAEAQSKSVVAYILPKDGNGTGELRRLLKEKKIAADLDFDKEGHLKKVTMHPLDEKISKNDKTGRIEIKDTVLLIERSGKETYDQAYSFKSGLWQLSMKSPKDEHVNMGYRGLQCDVDMDNAYYGTRQCRVAELSLDMDMQNGSSHEQTLFLFKGIDGNSHVVRKNGEIFSDGRIGIRQIVVNENSHREKFDFDIEGVEITGV